MMTKKVPKKRRQACRCSERFNAPVRKHFYLKMKSDLAYEKEKKTIWIKYGRKPVKNRCVVFSSQTEGSFVSDLFPWPSTFSLSSCQFLKFQSRSFESCRMETNPISASTMHHNDGGLQPMALSQPV